jgi:hypothetical protein
VVVLLQYLFRERINPGAPRRNGLGIKIGQGKKTMRSGGGSRRGFAGGGRVVSATPEPEGREQLASLEIYWFHLVYLQIEPYGRGFFSGVGRRLNYSQCVRGPRFRAVRGRSNMQRQLCPHAPSTSTSTRLVQLAVQILQFDKLLRHRRASHVYLHHFYSGRHTYAI